MWFTQCSRRSIAAEAVTFEAPKVTKSASQQKGFFAARVFALQIRLNLGCPVRTGLCPAALMVCIVLPDFGRSCSAEGKEKLIQPSLRGTACPDLFGKAISKLCKSTR
jgi:hypothetical protein